MGNVQTISKTKTNKNIPELRFPGFEGEWVENQLGNILEFKNGINADKDSYGKGVKFINVLDILNTSYITYDNIVGLVDVDETTRAKYDVSYGDLLFQRSSETRNEVGTANVYLDNEKSCTFGGFVIRGKKIGSYNPLFMKSLLSTSFVRKEITSWSGGSTRYNVGQEILKKIEYISPQKDEQNKIAAFLTAVDSKIDLLTKKKELMEQYKKGIMQKIFSQDIRFKDDDGNDYPDWEEKNIGALGDFIGGGTPLTSNKDFWDGDIPWISSSDLSNDSINELNISRFITKDAVNNSSTKIIPKGSVLIVSRVGVGKVAIAPNDICTSQDFTNINLFSDNNIFVTYLIKNNIKKLIEFNQGTSIKGFVKSELYNYKSYIPVIHEQNKIATFLTTIDTKLSSIDKELRSVQDFKKGLLQKMFI